ncbi:MAG: hypothetical protein ACTSRS_05590 [Candidatus Helarchaeota archaeon]
MRKKDWKFIGINFLVLFSLLFFTPFLFTTNESTLYNKKNTDILHNNSNQISRMDLNPFINNTQNRISINEIAVAANYIELINYGIAKNMTNWQIQIFIDDAYYRTYLFPHDWIFRQNSLLLIKPGSGINNELQLFTGWSFPWSTNVAIALISPFHTTQDWFQTSSYTGPRSSDICWINNSPIIFGLYDTYAYRNSDSDSDCASDKGFIDSGTK